MNKPYRYDDQTAAISDVQGEELCRLTLYNTQTGFIYSPEVVRERGEALVTLLNEAGE